MGEGPHVKINEWNPDGGTRGKGKWQTKDKYFQVDHKRAKQLEALKPKNK